MLKVCAGDVLSIPGWLLELLARQPSNVEGFSDANAQPAVYSVQGTHPTAAQAKIGHWHGAGHA